MNSKKTALILIAIQNEFASPGGELYDSVRYELYRTDMVRKTANLADVARKTGAHVFHAPLILSEKGSNHSNAKIGILKEYQDKALFINNTWNTEIINDHKPHDSDIIVKGINSLDAFSGSNLQELMQVKGIETVIIGGLLTNCSVESTMRTAYEKGYNVITLTDGTVCNSKHKHLAATEGTFKMFSTPMSCEQAAITLQENVLASHNSSLFSNTLSISSQPMMSLEEFTEMVLICQNEDSTPSEPAQVTEEARKDIYSQYKTTQVFIAPAGDWTKRVAHEIMDNNRSQSCWVRGPYTSPYSVASSFSHLVLVASGIGLTPALGIMGQYTGSSRSKLLVWSTKCPYMLKFFAPLLTDAHVAAIFYTGKDYELTAKELVELRSYGNIHIQQGRPKSLTAVIESLIVTYVNTSNNLMQHIHRGKGLAEIKHKITVDNMNTISLQDWCVLYCGGSQIIKDMIRKYTKEKGISFHSEVFAY